MLANEIRAHGNYPDYSQWKREKITKEDAYKLMKTENPKWLMNKCYVVIKPENVPFDQLFFRPEKGMVAVYNHDGSYYKMTAL